MIDRDLVRSCFNCDLEYSKKNREENIKRIIYGAHVLEEANIIGIVCNIPPFQNLEDICRKNLKIILRFIKKIT